MFEWECNSFGYNHSAVSATINTKMAFFLPGYVESTRKIISTRKKIEDGWERLLILYFKVYFEKPSATVVDIKFCMGLFFYGWFSVQKMYDRHERNFDIEIVRVIELPMWPLQRYVKPYNSFLQKGDAMKMRLKLKIR